ncbi:DUF424 family protein [Candidatus Micrarchaeota archaeon]|nr:DUF424 family protein [Candidatus Micrarchaeota archaeon]MBI5177171.1 DUF424 family protein [Candidatus Micrarchaeota archaeon]
MPIVAKVHTRTLQGVTRTVVAACDSELLGKAYSSGGLVLDLKAYAPFYKGERVSAKRLGEMLEGVDSVNLVGGKAIAAAGKVISVKLSDAKKIGGVPHLQYYNI